MDNLLIKVTEQGMHSMVRRFVTPFVVQGKADRTGRDMYIIAGLGNPERKYDGTRHNVGFAVVDILAKEYGIDLTEKKFKAIYGKGRIGEEKVILAKPLTYMNLSGESIGQMAEYFKIDPVTDLIIISDDIDQEIGNIRVRPKGSAGGHNGLKNIILHLGTEEFKRIRIGVGHKPAGMDLADHVLSHFSAGQQKEMTESMNEAAEAVKVIIEQGAGAAMNLFNGKKGR